jgi:hypothetical protein
MVKELEKYIQDLADITAFIVDRAIVPEKTIGQAWLISKGRAVTLASSVFHYTEAPWALALKFPYPDLVLSVKSITLHPDFNKRDARSNYLSTGTYLKPIYSVFENDIATVTLEPELLPLAPEKAAELNRAMALPLNISPQDMSGVMRAHEAGSIIQQALSTGQSSLITMLDARNYPFARISIKQGRIAKAIYKNLTNELGLCELIWQKPPGNFIVQSIDNFAWSNITDINIPTEQLGIEANRRAQELPKLIESIGGPDARYERKQQIDINKFGQGQRWMVEQVWSALDGYLPFSQITERVSLDTYSVAKTLLELKNQDLVVQSDSEPFHKSCALGNPLIPGNDIEANAGDNLTAFYLDPISKAPCRETGTFFGAKSISNNTSLLHTINLPNAKHGALIIKEKRIIGVHNGPYQAKQGQTGMPDHLGHMTWIGSLSANSVAKKLRTSEMASASSIAEEPETIPQEMFASQKTSGVMRRMTGEQSLSGTYPEMEPPAEEPAQDFLGRFSKNQVIAASALVLLIGIVMIAASFFAGPKVPSNVPSGEKPQPVKKIDSKQAAKIAVNIAGFSRVPPKDFTYELVTEDPGFRKDPADPNNPNNGVDTIDENNAFELVSKQLNQRILFLLWGNTAPIDNMEFFIRNKTLPVFNWEKTDAKNVMKKGKSDRMIWFAGRFLKPIIPPEEDPEANLLETIVYIGAFPSRKPGRCVFVLGRTYSDEGNLDFGLTNKIVEELLAQSNPDMDGEEAQIELATAEEITAYRQSIAKVLQEHFKLPKKYDKKNPASILLVLDNEGEPTKIEVKGTDALAEALQKSVLATKPYAKPPVTKDKSIGMNITLVQDKIVVEEP